MRFCYFLWALSLTIGIFFYNFFIFKKYDIDITNRLILILFLVASLPAVLLIRKICLNAKKARILFLPITVFMLFVTGFLSSSFYYNEINEFSLLAAQNNFLKNSDIQLVSSGRIISIPYQKFDNIFFEFKITSLEILNKKANKLALLGDCGNIFIKYKIKESNSFGLNDYVKLDIVKIDNYSKDNESIPNTFTASNIALIKEKAQLSFLYSFRAKIHGCLSYLFLKCLSGQNANLAAALILGIQSNISHEITESFKKSGIYHILAISGLHISIIALFMLQILRKIFSSGKTGKIIISCIIVLFLIFYNFIVGEKASMLRATIMFCLVFFSKDIFKDYSQSNVLLITYMVLLFARPDYLTNIGFILSFASVAALIYIAPIIKKCITYFLKLKNEINNYFIRSIIAAFSINLFILPILSHYYGGFSLISIFTNITAAPVFFILILDLFISSIASVMWFTSGSFLLLPADFLMNMIIRISEFFNSLPFGYMKTEIFEKKVNICLYYFALMVIFSAANLFFKKRIKE